MVFAKAFSITVVPVSQRIHTVFRINITKENYDPDFVYNAYKIGLNWSALLQKILISKND